jgi:hypothetical protein
MHLTRLNLQRHLLRDVRWTFFWGLVGVLVITSFACAIAIRCRVLPSNLIWLAGGLLLASFACTVAAQFTALPSLHMVDWRHPSCVQSPNH